MGVFRRLFGKKKTGLALGGGAVLGAAHVGVLRALEEDNTKIDYLAGTSIGAFVGALYAFGKTTDEIEAISKSLKWLDIARISLGGPGLLRLDGMKKLIKQHLGDARIEDASIPLSMIATDASTGDKVILNKGSLADAVAASCCIPGIFIPVEIDNRLLFDGGVVENVPGETVRNMGADKVIGVDLNAKHFYGKPKTLIDVLVNTFHFAMMAAAKLHTANLDIALKPDLSEFNRADMSQVPKLIAKGYSETKKALAEMKK